MAMNNHDAGSREKELRVVQFLHSGMQPRLVEGEPRWRSQVPTAVQTDSYVPWNRGSVHYRRFMVSDAMFMQRKKGKVHNGRVGFWGEWEPPSLAATIDDPKQDFPNAIHTPILIPDNNEWNRRFPPKRKKGCTPDYSCMNTDPFVFGSEFYYTLCRQESRPLMRRLDVGSIILFGSRKQRKNQWKFVLDTVFVVGESMQWPHDRDAIYARTPIEYHQTTLNMIDSNHQLTFYIGAMHDSSINGMFSFVPCAPFDVDSPGVAQVDIAADFIRPGMTQGISTLRASPDDARSVWNAVADQVLAAGQNLGVRIDMPPSYSGTR